MAAVTQIVISGKDELSGILSQASARMSQTMERMSSDLRGVSSDLDGIKTTAMGVFAYLTGGAISSVAKDLVGVSSSFETLHVSLKTVTGSSAAAQASLDWITEFTATTPYQLEEVANAFRKLTAYGMDATEVLPILGDTASAMGKTLDQAVEMFADAAQGQFQRLREFGVRAEQQGDQVTFAWQENGQQMTATAAKTQAGITAELNKIFERFQGGMEEQSRTWEGTASNMEDVWTLWKKDVMDAGPFEFLKSSMSDVADNVESDIGRMKLKEWAKEAGDMILNAFEVASYAVQALAYPINGIKGAFSALKLAIVSVEETALNMYERIHGMLPESMSLSASQIQAIRMTIEQTRAEANAGLDSVERGNAAITETFSRLRGHIDAARGASNRAAEEITDGLQKVGAAADSTAEKVANATTPKGKKGPSPEQIEREMMAATERYYRYVADKNSESIELQLKRLELQRDAELKNAAASTRDLEERKNREKNVLARFERDKTDLLTKGERDRQKIREEMEQRTFDLTATEYQKQMAITERYIEESRQKWLEAGQGTVEEFERMADGYRQAMQRAYDPVTKEREKLLQEQEDASKKTLERIEGATADVFYQMFKNARDGWKNLWSGMKDWALKTLSELAARAAMTKIVVPVLTSVTGTGTASAAVSALSGQQGGARGQLGNLPFGSLFSGGSGGIANSINSWAASSFPSVWGAGGLLGPSVVNSGYTAAISNPSLYTSGMGFSSEAVATGALQGTGYGTATNTTSTVAGTGTSFLSTIGGLAGIGGGIYQMTQGGAGNIVGGAGTAIGGAMMFTPAAPFAPLVMLGSQLLGGLLGGKKEHSPSIIFQAQETPWGQTDDLQWHSKSKASWKMGNELAGNVGQVFGATFEQVEGMLSAYGDQYVGMLKDATVTWGRKAGGAWKEWDFGTDMKPEELMEKVVADIKGQVFKAAGPAFSKVGEDFADSDAVKNAYALLEDKAKQFGQIEDVIRAGVQDGNVEAYIQQLQAFQAAIANTSATWEAVSQASAQVLEPLSQYEAAQRQLNAQYDGWIASLAALGIAQENIQKIEEDRTAALAKMADDNAKAIQDVINAANEAVTPLSTLAAAQRRINAQFDGLAGQLRNLGAAAEYATQVEAGRQAALAAAAAQQASALRYAQAELSGTVDQHNINEIAARYGWGDKYIKDGQINRENVQRDAIDWFKTASEQSVSAMETHHGVKREQLVQDVKYLDNYFKKLDEAAKPVEPKITLSTPKIERMNTAVDRSASEFERLTRALMEYRRRTLSDEKGGLSLSEREKYTRQEFDRLSALALGGDKEAASALTAAADAYAETARKTATTQASYALIMGGVLETVQQVARVFGKKAGLPGFATGGYHLGGLRIVGEDGPELEATGPSRIWNAAQTRSILSGGESGLVPALLAEVRQLRRQLMASQGAIAQSTLDSSKILRRWNGGGIPAPRVA